MGIGKEFMEKTKYQYLEKSAQERGVAQPALEQSYPSDSQLIELPEPDSVGLAAVDLTKLFRQRRSLRSYSKRAFSQEELSFLLWASQGVKKEVKDKATFRPVPSAGARHAFETYLLINNVTGLAAGLYRYLALEHKLILINQDSGIAERLLKASLGQKTVRAGAATFIWTAITERMNWRYGERGYRYLHLDAGHVCQNLYLAAEAIKAGVCAIGAYDDDQVNDILQLDGQQEFVIYMAAVGKKEVTE